MKKGTVYQIKLALAGIRPTIWRRMQLPADCTMDATADALLTVMGWSGYGEINGVQSMNQWGQTR